MKDPRTTSKDSPRGATSADSLLGDSRFLDTILGALDTLVVALDHEGRVVYFNRACEVTSGFAFDEIRGRPVWETLILPDEAAGVRAVFENILEGRLPSRYENHWRTRDGRRRWIAWSNTFLRKPDGSIEYIIGTGRDITDLVEAERDSVLTRARLELSEAGLRAVVETAVDAIITIDEQGTIQSVNPAVERMFGYPAGELVGRNASMLMPSPYREEHDGYIANYLRTGQKKIIGIGREVAGRRKDGTVFPCHLSVSEMRVGGRRMFTGIARDLTELKRMQEELVRSRSLSAIGETAASIAHEVRNPLAAISGPIQVLRDTLPEDDTRREVMTEVLGQVRRLDETIRKLLMVAKPWKPKPEACRPRDIVDRIVGLAAEHPAFRSVRFAVEDVNGRSALLDASLFEQVLWNVFLNSAQAMPKGGEIRVTISEASRFVTISIADTGPGVPEEVKPRLFRPFVTTKPEGSGLGLAISRRIIEAHGGTMEIASDPGRGTTVKLTVPLAP